MRIARSYDSPSAQSDDYNLTVIFISLLLVVLSLGIPDVHAATRGPVRAKNAMVVSAQGDATQAGVDVLKAGGNAVDAAVAVGFALAVTHPRAGNLGGGGFMLIRFADGRATFLDFRERAPGSAHRDMYLGPDGVPTDEVFVGYRASGVPGTPRGLEMAAAKYGRKPLPELIEPAIRLARDGFEVDFDQSLSFQSKRMAGFPESRRIFQRDGRYYEMGERFKQPDLQHTLERIAMKGADDFYSGETAHLIAADMKKNNGTITLEDLKDYKPAERTPIKGSYRGYEIITSPPPSSGGVGIIQMLNMLEGSGYERSGPGSAAAIHYVAETMRRYFADRSAYFGDPDFVSVPVEQLTNKHYSRQRAATIDRGRAGESLGMPPGLGSDAESTETTHYSVVDSDGNAVAVTYTLNGSFGSGVTAVGTGVLFNNEMDDFSAKPGFPNEAGLLTSEKNAIAPGKRPLSSMVPTIVARDGKLSLVVGSPGGPTIISTVLEVILNVIDFEMDIQQAVDFPRFHHQWMPDELRLERPGLSQDTIERLLQRGHSLKFVEKQGRVMAIQADGEWLLGAADARSEGSARGF
ncbi:MAG: gamma-glutamyltransferase [Acidobacteria bacterium]|nr:gamma-glutamyltransferase [Acidobacteriota bacterium]